MRDPATVITRVRAALARPLPGPEAHRLALPEGLRREDPPAGMPITGAAVLLALRLDPATEEWSFPVIRRPDSMERHAGQIALPGGAIDRGETSVACALREAEEEIGLAADCVEVLGALTPFVIPVSGYRVDPFVGWVLEPVTYRPQESEVEEVLIADPDRLAREGPHLRLPRERSGMLREFPAYDVEGELVWGATALILAEFLEIWREVRGIAR
jgi:8-oxo-dGTP pyrophosphatase MutT (NUDIX family)